ncbi:MAG: exodeoxyribonuclease VII small subunit [Saprospiraceae bacterium]|nr:exodeoxyribonuclease VII small subunit [Saprospiraceae bacterium]
MKPKFSYEEAMKELQSIVQALQEGHINMDTLAERAGRAAELIRLCRERLRLVEAELDELFPEE